MNKVISINLGGCAYQLDEGGYDALRAYLETAAARLKNNPDRDEILLDIERAISEKFRALLSANKNVVETNEVNAVIADMGPVETEPGSGPESSFSSSSSSSSSFSSARAPGTDGGHATPKRLYRVMDGAMFAGVCNGIGAYFNIDPTFIRLAFAFSMIMWGAGLMLYVVLMFVIPEANTPEEKAAASGDFPPTAQEFIRRAQEGYYKAMKDFPNYKRAHRKWYREWKRQMRMHSWRWRHYHWQNYWHWRWNWKAHSPGPVHPVMGFTMPFLAVLHGAAKVLWICAFISLLATGTLFGMALPGHVPVWIAILLLFIFYAIVVSPIKSARHAYYWSSNAGSSAADPSAAATGAGGPHWVHPVIALVDTIVGIIVMVILLCLALAYFPELRQALESFPTVAHEAIQSVKSWWHEN